VHIGLDFDNTIVSYDALFHRVAMDEGLVSEDIPCSKVAIRDYLRRIGKEDSWTEMQGLVYGRRMSEASVYPGVINSLKWARKIGIKLSIVSHKTKHPFLGPQYNLHEAAREWIQRNLNDQNQPLIGPENIFFELTKELKVARISKIGCNFFIDDLPEIFENSKFPLQVKKILFDPDNYHKNLDFIRLQNWSDVPGIIGSQ